MPGPDADPDGGRDPLIVDDVDLVEALADAARLDVEAFERVTTGLSRDAVFRLAGRRPAFAKISSVERSGRDEFLRECDVLAWLSGRFGAPRLIWSGTVGGRTALVAEAVDGLPLHEVEDAEAAAVAGLEALSALHELRDCPFDARLAVKLPAALRRVQAGEVDERDFDPERQGRAARELFAELIERVPVDEDVVVAHGDACWPNIILRPDGPAGIVDLGRFGLADRHQDLALFLRSAAFNAPDLDARRLLAEAYRGGPVDERKLEFYQWLDEFF